MGHAESGVDLQYSNRGTTDGRQTNQRRPLPSKMLHPPVDSRVKQKSLLTSPRINASDVRPLWLLHLKQASAKFSSAV